MEGFREIYQGQYISLCRTAKKMLGNAYDATDIIQEVFIDFLDQSKNGEQIKHPRSWLYRVTLNKCVDLSRTLNKLENQLKGKGYEMHSCFVSELDANKPLDEQEFSFTVISPDGIVSEHIVRQN